MRGIDVREEAYVRQMEGFALCTTIDTSTRYPTALTTAAGHHNSLARHPSGVFGGQEHRDPRDVFRLSESPSGVFDTIFFSKSLPMATSPCTAMALPPLLL